MNNWLLFFLMALGTYAWRFSMIYLFGRIEIPEKLKRALRFVPPTVLLSLILPGVLRTSEGLDLSFANPRFYALLAAGLVAYYSKNILLTLAVGMGILWTWQAFF